GGDRAGSGRRPRPEAGAERQALGGSPSPSRTAPGSAERNDPLGRTDAGTSCRGRPRIHRHAGSAADPRNAGDRPGDGPPDRGGEGLPGASGQTNSAREIIFKPAAPARAALASAAGSVMRYAVAAAGPCRPPAAPLRSGFLSAAGEPTRLRTALLP